MGRLPRPACKNRHIKSRTLLVFSVVKTSYAFIRIRLAALFDSQEPGNAIKQNGECMANDEKENAEILARASCMVRQQTQVVRTCSPYFFRSLLLVLQKTSKRLVTPGLPRVSCDGDLSTVRTLWDIGDHALAYLHALNRCR